MSLPTLSPFAHVAGLVPILIGNIGGVSAETFPLPTAEPASGAGSAPRFFELLHAGRARSAIFARRVPAMARAAGAALAKAPGTMAYLLAIIVTWTTLEGTSSKQAEHLIETASTNLHNMTHTPARVLFASAFWIDRGDLWITLIEFVLVMAFVERWLGTLRMFTIFVAGHVGATLITVVGISLAIHAGWASQSLSHTADVGVSYGFVAVAAAATYAITNRRIRAVVIAAMVAYLGISLAIGGTFTDYGHLTALGIGFAVYPVLSRVGRTRSDEVTS